MAKQRMRLKKEFQRKGSKEDRLKSMGKYMADIASNVVSSVLGEKAGRFTEDDSDDDADFQNHMNKNQSSLITPPP